MVSIDRYRESRHALTVPQNHRLDPIMTGFRPGRRHTAMERFDLIRELRDQNVSYFAVGSHLLKQRFVGKAPHLQEPVDRFSDAIHVQRGRWKPCRSDAPRDRVLARSCD